MELIYGKESTSAVGSSNGNTGTWSNNTDAENVAVAAAYRATLRIPCVTVYCILPASATNRCSPSDDNTNTNDTTTEEEDCLSLDTFRDSSYVLKDDKTEIGAANFAGRRLLFLLKKSFPCHLIQLRPQDFWPSSEQEPGPDNNVNYTIPNPHCYGTEQMATVASVEMLFASRHTLVLDGGMPALTMTMLAPNNNNTENSNDNNKKMKMEDDEEKRGEKVAAHDTAAPRAKRSIRIVGDARTVSVCTKLQRLHEATGALPLISTAQVLEALSCLQNRNDSLPMFATNTTNAMLGAVLHETILIVRAAIKEWAESVFNFQTTSTISLAKSYPLVCITGIEGDILMKLLTSGLVEMEPDPDFIWRADNPNIEENAPALLQVRLSSSGPMMDIEVKKHRHMSFNGLPQMLMKYGNLRKETMTEVEKLRQEVLGCRVAKDFGPQQGGIYFGQVVSINRTRPETIDEDLVRVRFDDGDEEDYSVTQLYGTHACYFYSWFSVVVADHVSCSLPTYLNRLVAIVL